MYTGILAGGLGTRLREETETKPKPMVEVGAHPIIWHIMSIYAAHGFGEFIVALGYKGKIIRNYFDNNRNGWNVHMLDTGLHTKTGGRIKRLLRHVKAPMMLTYGDGVANIDIRALLDSHRAHGKLATVTAVHPPSRFGKLVLNGSSQVCRFEEKPQDEGWINGGFFVLEPGVADYISGDDVVFEREPLEALAQDGQLVAYQHSGFWQCMDTLRDATLLNELWQQGDAPWKI